MRISSGGDVPRVDLETLRRLVPPLWTEWAGLEFSVEGLLRDPDSGRPLRLLQLLHGRHREPGARYAIFEDEAKPGDQLCFDLTSDDGRTVRGTLNSQWWSAELEIGDRLCAAGRADVAAALRASDVPDFLVPLIGGRAATGSVRIDMSRLDRGGELVSGHAQAQRGAGDLTVDVKPGRDEWNGRITVHITGRGLLGRVALLAFRSKTRSGIRDAVDELVGNTAKQTVALQSGLEQVADQIRVAGEQAFVHLYFWKAARELAASTGAPAVAASTATVGADRIGASTRLRRGPLGARRLQRPLELNFPLQSAGYLIPHGSITRTGELIVRPGRDQVMAHWPSEGRYDAPPTFHGHVERRADTMTIRGVIRETPSARLWPLTWGFVTCLMGFTAIFGIVGVASGSSQALAPLLIGAIGGPIFALFWRSARKDRRPDFTRRSAELEDGLQRWFTSGDGNRTSRL